MLPAESVDEGPVGEEKEGVERPILRGHTPALAPVNAHRCVVLQVDGNDMVIGSVALKERVHPRALFLLLVRLDKGAMRSMGTGKIVVEFFSEATSVNVCKNRSCSAVGCFSITSAACAASGGWNSPSAWITFARRSRSASPGGPWRAASPPAGRSASPPHWRS